MNWRRTNIRLRRLEAESIHILRETAATFANPVMLYSIGKDSGVVLHIARKAFAPGKPPFPLLHVDTTWKFREMITFRDEIVGRLGADLLVHTNQDALARGVSPVTNAAMHTQLMKTEALRQALDAGKSELWRLYNTRVKAGESMRVFPLSNWTEIDVWEYIRAEQIPIVPLYFAKERPVVKRDGVFIMVDDDRLPLLPGETPTMMRVRFRTLGCYPLTGAIESAADTVDAIIDELRAATVSEREGRVIDQDDSGSMEAKKREGYF
ncbi:MAG: sulfate adenylyltransferase subunit 2 [Chloroflexi bacterium]|nr:sulfate adenylyltransferase subunit 2 [Chloroflexota bacterium]